jgi:hypothetical protein
LFKVPRLNWIYSRRFERLACLQVEAGMVSRASHRSPNHKALCKRTMVMRTVGRDRKYLGPGPNQKDFFPMRMTQDLPAIRQLVHRNPCSEIRAR